MTGPTAESELIAQLRSDKRTVRIQAIVKLTRAGQSEQALRALAPFARSDDRETAFFASQAINKIEQKTGLKLQEILNESVQAAEADHQSLSAKTFLTPPQEKINELLELIRSTPETISVELLPAVGVFLGRYGNMGDAQFIEQQLMTDNSNLALPFINAAENVAPQVLPRVLPTLLASREPLVRSRAVSALRKIDPDEAERHFSDLLASRDPEDRLAGIGIAILFPFDRVKGYLLSILPEEQDQEVLDACQTVLASNPELDTALSVLDSIDAVPAEQKNRLSKVFKTICKGIGIAGILPSDQATPENLVKIWKQQRLQSFLYDLEIQLACADKGKKKAIVEWIQKNRQHPKVVELIERLGRNPQTEDVYRLLSVQTKDKAPEKIQTGKSTAQSGQAPENDNDKIALLKTLEIDSFAENRSWIVHEAANGTAKIRTEALNTLLRIRPDVKMKDLARSALEAEDIEVRIAGFKMLERYDPDFLKDKIAALLLENDPNLRVRAVRFGLKFEEKASIEALQKLLGASEQNVRSNAISCLALCPFNLVFKMLMNQLDREDHPVIARQICNILLSNPAKPVLKALDDITRTSNPAVAMVISQARNDLFDIVSQMPTPAESEQTEKREDLSEKPYSVGKVREIARKNQSWKPSYKADPKTASEIPKEATNWQLIISGAVVLIFLAMLPIMLLSEKEAPEPKRQTQQDYRVNERVKPVQSNIPVKFRMNRACSLSGKVEKIVSDTSLVMIHESTQLMVKFETPEAKPFKQGDDITVTVVPYRVNPNGIILSRGQKITAATGEKQ